MNKYSNFEEPLPDKQRKTSLPPYFLTSDLASKYSEKIYQLNDSVLRKADELLGRAGDLDVRIVTYPHTWSKSGGVNLPKAVEKHLWGKIVYLDVDDRGYVRGARVTYKLAIDEDILEHSATTQQNRIQEYLQTHRAVLVNPNFPDYTLTSTQLMQLFDIVQDRHVLPTIINSLNDVVPAFIEIFTALKDSEYRIEFREKEPDATNFLFPLHSIRYIPLSELSSYLFIVGKEVLYGHN